jgi:hypothetical protein
MEQIECFETSANINQTPGKHPKDSTLNDLCLVISRIFTNVQAVAPLRTAQVLCHKQQHDCRSVGQEFRYVAPEWRTWAISPEIPQENDKNFPSNFYFSFKFRSPAHTHIAYPEKHVSKKSEPCRSISFRDIESQMFRNWGKFVLHATISKSIIPQRI